MTEHKINNHKHCKYQNRHKACPARQPNEHVEAVRSCVQDKEIVLIGGKPNRESSKLIERALGVRLHWLETTGTESYREFQSAVERNNVAVVILAIRWVRHGHGKVKGLCSKAQKHFVSLPGGYNPNQIAYQIRLQCGNVLGCAL